MSYYDKLALFNKNGAVIYKRENGHGSTTDPSMSTTSYNLNCLLSAAASKRCNLKEIDLSRTTINNLVFCGIDLSGGDFSLTCISGGDFASGNFSKANFEKADILSKFENANLFGANFHEAKVLYTKFCGANLSRANFVGADLRGANFIGANLSYADLRGARLEGVIFNGRTKLKGAKIDCDLTPTQINQICPVIAAAQL